MEPTNDDRGEWALQALIKFGELTRQRKNDKWDEEIELVVSDLLADMMHFCRREGIDFDNALDRGRGHFREEEREEKA